MCRMTLLPQQAILGLLQFDPARLPGQLDVLVADVLDQVRLDERVLHAHPGQPAHARIDDVIPAHDGVTDDRRATPCPNPGRRCRALRHWRAAGCNPR